MEKVRRYILGFLFLCFMSCQNPLPMDMKHQLVNAPVSTGVVLTDSVVTIYKSGVNTRLVTLPNGMVMEKRDSLYYWDDMVFSEHGLEIFDNNGRSACRDEVQFYWPHGVVYYRFNNVPFSERPTFEAALDSIENKTSIVFRYRNNNIANYIYFNKSSTNDSFVGMQQGAQIINIKTVDVQVIMHEVMHALGFFHEHNRTDRDNYIVVNTANIKDNRLYAFQKYSVNYSGWDLGDLDFQSIMIYDSMIYDTLFVYNTSVPAMTKLNGDLFQQGSTLSVDDVKGVNSIYGPPFHRLEHHRLNVIADYVNGFNETLITENSDSLVFYADKECTIRQPLPFQRRIKLKKTVTYNDGYDILSDTTYEFYTIPAGTKSFNVWTGYNYECYYCSNPSNIHITEYEVVNEHVSDVSYLF